MLYKVQGTDCNETLENTDTSLLVPSLKFLFEKSNVAWKILRSKEFTDQVLPIYFNHPNYNSFIRLVNAWGFRRVTTGLDANAYFHEVRILFQQSDDQLCIG